MNKNDEVGKLLMESIVEHKKIKDAEKTTNKGEVPSMETTKKKSLAGIIGAGAGGSNVAHLLNAYGYDTAALNTTVVDMTELNVGTKITIQGLDGSGKDRKYAETEFKRSYKSFFSHDRIVKLIQNNDLIFVIATAGGGTGTILSVLVAGYIKKEFPNKNVVLVGLLGSLKEDKISQENMCEFLSDVSNKLQCPYMLFDNNRVTNVVGDDVYEAVNNEAVMAIRFLSREFMVENTRRNLDGRDYARLMSFPGLMSVTIIQNLGISISEPVLMLDDKVKAAMSASTAIITSTPDAYGVFMNVPPEIYTKVDTTFESLQNIIGKPTSGLVLGHLQNETVGPQFGLITTGLEAPLMRFEAIQKRIKEYSVTKQKASIPEVTKGASVKLAGDTGISNTGAGDDFMGSF